MPLTVNLPKRDSTRVDSVRLAAALCMSVPLLLLGALLVYLPEDLTLATNPSEFWTLVSGVSAILMLSVTIGVGIIAWYGLRSLRLARQDMVTRATREARSIALLRAEEFSRMIRGEHLVIQSELLTANIDRFTQSMQSGVAIFDNPVLYHDAKLWWSSVPAETRTRITFFLNDLEAWAMYFTKELAESEVLFGPCAPTFCSMIMQYSPWILVARKEQYVGYYPNCVALFNAWRAELDAMERGSTTEAALRAANAAADRLAKHRMPSPLGTRVDI